MDKKAKLSVIILTRNSIPLTETCLDSLDPLVKESEDVEVVVVDNGSQQEEISSYQSRFQHWGNRLKAFRLDRNAGVAGGRNYGISKASATDYVLILDNDTRVTPSAIQNLIDFMEKNPDVGIAAPALTALDGTIQKSFKKFPGIFEKFRNLLGAKQHVDAGNVTEVIYPFYVIGACQLIRRSAMNKIGLLDDNIFFGPEDADYCMRVREAGYKVAYLPQISIVHHWQRDSARLPFSKTSRAHIRGLLYFYKKWHRFW